MLDMIYTAAYGDRCCAMTRILADSMIPFGFKLHILTDKPRYDFGSAGIAIDFPFTYPHIARMAGYGALPIHSMAMYLDCDIRAIRNPLEAVKTLKRGRVLLCQEGTYPVKERHDAEWFHILLSDPEKEKYGYMPAINSGTYAGYTADLCHLHAVWISTYHAAFPTRKKIAYHDQSALNALFCRGFIANDLMPIATVGFPRLPECGAMPRSNTVFLHYCPRASAEVMK